MDSTQLQDRVYWGLNRFANILGVTTDAYRPQGDSHPLRKTNRFLRLRAAFSKADGNFSQPVDYGVAIWRGYFDASYTRVGDYMVQKGETWFIVSQQHLQPVLCVKSNRIISVTRSNTPTTGASYDSASPNSTTTIISGWPASVLGTDARGKSSADLPADTATQTSIVLLPAPHGRVFQSSDFVVDELGVTNVIVGAELSDLGWRLNVRQVTT